MRNPDADFARAFFAEPGAAPRPMPTNALLAALGAELVAHNPATGEVTMRFSPPETFRQGAGHIQGGAISAMLDFAMILAAFAVIPVEASVSTATMTTAFLAPGKGASYTAVGQIEKAGRRMVFARARLLDGEREIASASSTMLVL